MANKKFSEFDLSVNVGSVSELVGLNGTRNVKITPTNLLSDVNETISLLDDRVILNDAKVGITQQQANDILTNNDKVGITQQQTSDIITNNAKVGITTEQASDIITNNDKVGITTEQADAIVDNTNKVGITTDQANNIVTNNAKVGITTQQANDILTNNDKVGITTEQATAIVDNTAKVGITTTQANDILANNNKVGITTEQADDIVTNNAKVGITTQQASDITTNNAKVGITTTQADAIVDNTQAITDEENARILADIVLQDNLQVQIDDITGSINQPNGIAGLNPGGKINNSAIPTSVNTDTINSQTIFNGGNLTSDTLTVISQLNFVSQATVSAVKSFTLSTYFVVPANGGTVNWYSFGSLPNKSGLLSVSASSNVAIYNFATQSNGNLSLGDTVGGFGNGVQSLSVVNGNQLQIRNNFFMQYSGTFTLKILYLD